MDTIHRIAALALLAASGLFVACNDLPTAPKEAEAAQDQVAQVVQDSKVDPQSMSDRELLLAVLGRLDNMEARIENGGQASVTPYVMSRARIDRTKGADPEATPPDESPSEGQGQGPPDESPSPQQPQGVPQQLAELRTQLEDIQGDLGDFEEALELAARRTDTVLVALGFEAPDQFDPDKTFQLASSLCVEVGTELSTGISGEMTGTWQAEGGLGIDIYGNGLELDFEGEGEASGRVAWDNLYGDLNYSHCINMARPEAQNLSSALGISPSGLSAKIDMLTMQLSDLRSMGASHLFSANFDVLGERLPDSKDLLNGAKGLFDGIRVNLCSRLMNDSRWDSAPVIDKIEIASVKPFKALTDQKAIFEAQCKG